MRRRSRPRAAYRAKARYPRHGGAPVHASVIRWSRGVAQYAVGHRDLVREAVTAARTHKMVLAGADYRGPGVNDLCADADLVVDEVRAW